MVLANPNYYYEFELGKVDAALSFCSFVFYLLILRSFISLGLTACSELYSIVRFLSNSSS